jgi:2,3,4,5-tetrahydropyridine-2-carboxylate N-succinyltransferase
MKTIKTKKQFGQTIETIKETTPGYRDPIGFGICRVDRGQKNEDKILQAIYPLINWDENFGSAAIIIQALIEQNNDIDFTKSEAVFNINLDITESCLNAFNPYIDEAIGDKHKNVQVISMINSILYRNYLEDELDAFGGDMMFTSDDLSTFKVCFIFDDTKVESVEVAYLKLYALSQAKVELRSICLDGAFGALPNVAWSNGEPIELDWLRENEMEMKLNGDYPNIDFVDKFPRFLQHIIPADNTRILDTSRVRFGAQLAAGTTVMPGASYINFNAGTTGSVMVEGRISSSAIVGDGSDVGGGASILGVLSGTDGNPISVGKNSLLGANSVCGIPIGDACIIDAGVSILEGTKLTIKKSELRKIMKVNDNEDTDLSICFETFISEDDNEVITAKAQIFENCNGIHYRQNSLTGEIIAMRSTREIKLNADLH